MAHLKPVSKAGLSWSGDASFLDILTGLANFFKSISPIITEVIDAKNTSETTS
jgi:hypothetical protein